MSRLDNSFYGRHVAQVAQDLLGKILVFGEIKGTITETEAYRGSDDEASHAFKFTPRSSIMYGPPGFSYVYLIYGMYYCLNIVTEEVNCPSAVLIRGLKLSGDMHLDGPGKICRYLGITKEHNGINLVTDNNFYLTEGATDPITYNITSRIGIKKAIDKQWRFLSN